ncbi:hypothetical protein EVAR_14578_1 [Eumeta japonica]|uniref:Uncharacterized protein n=1 Tax=Eumeta variegata TaxID=151549 RepID=A0A4C1UUB0_EUMVA|nr:hypothetical protein EVAR_14578_1 [Eumeta japonica]
MDMSNIHQIVHHIDKSGPETEIENCRKRVWGQRRRLKSMAGINIQSATRFKPRLRLTTINTKDEEVHSLSMLTYMRALTIRADHSQERAEQHLPNRLVLHKLDR